MKKLFFIMMFGLLTAGQTKAQEVFNQVVNNAKLVLEDPKADPFITAVSQFKYTALQYLCTTAIKVNGGGVAADLLDRQAFALNDFISSYFKEVSKAQHASEATRKGISRRFWRACVENPMFENQDPDITEAFINDPDCITPFPINVDWEKADEAAKKKK